MRKDNSFIIIVIHLKEPLFTRVRSAILTLTSIWDLMSWLTYTCILKKGHKTLFTQQTFPE